MQNINAIYTLEPEMGFLPEDDDSHPELYGYSVTMDGRVVVQQLMPAIDEYIGDDLAWEDLEPGENFFEVERIAA